MTVIPPLPDSLVGRWAAATVRPVSSISDRHSFHAYFNVSPESPDGRFVVFFASRERSGERGDVVVLDRKSGEERVVAQDIATEDAHRVACQQWALGSRFVVYHEPVGTHWRVMAWERESGRTRVLADGWQLGFGTPWGERWTDFLTGYNAPVRNGAYVAPAWRDSYVFGSRLERIGIGRAGGKTYIVTDDNVTLKQFAQNAIKAGIDTLVNLDGGGSRHLYYNGTVYASGRVPYNAIVWYGETPANGCPYPTPTGPVRLWSSGDAVRWVQWQLNRHGASLAVDGSFGLLTWYALRGFQRDKALTVDGVAGPMTISALSSAVNN